MFGFKKFISLFRYSAVNSLPAATDTYIAPHADEFGNQYASLVVGAAPLLVEGNNNNTDTIAPSATNNKIPVISYLTGYDNVNNDFDRLRTIPDNANGQAELGLGTLGVVARLQGWNGATFDRIRSQGDNVDAVATAANGHLSVLSHGALFNGSNFDRKRGNQPINFLASAVRNATTNSGNITNYNGKGADFIIDVTAVPGVDTVTPSIQIMDVTSGKFVTILTGAAIVAVSTVRLVVYPGITPAANISISDILSRTFRVVMTHSGAGNFTYSVGGTIVL